MRQNIAILIFTMLVSLLANSQGNDDDLTSMGAPTGAIEIFLSSENQNVARRKLDLPNNNNNLLFLEEPLSLQLSDIRKMEFGSDNFGSSALILQLNYSFAELLSQFPEDYVYRYLALMFDEVVFYSAVVNAPLNMSRIEIPIPKEQDSRIFHEIFLTWSSLQNDESIHEEYHDNYSYSNDYGDNALAPGLYITIESTSSNENITQRLSNSELYIYNEPLVHLHDFDSIYFHRKTEDEFMLMIDLSSRNWNIIQQSLTENPQQKLVLVQEDEFWGLLHNDAFTTKKQIEIVMNSDVFLDFTSLYLSKYHWEDGDVNMDIVEQFYQDMNDRVEGFFGGYKKSHFQKSEINLMTPGAYQIVMQTLSKHDNSKQKDTLDVEILNDDWMIILQTDIFGENQYELTANEFKTFGDESGNLFLNLPTLGLIDFKKKGAHMFAASTNENWDFVLEIEIIPLAHASKSAILSGNWLVTNILIDDEVQNLQEQQIFYQFNNDGTLSSNDKKGNWFLSPSNQFIAMIENEYGSTLGLFEVEYLTPKVLTLNVLPYRHSKIQLQLERR